MHVLEILTQNIFLIRDQYQKSLETTAQDKPSVTARWLDAPLLGQTFATKSDSSSSKCPQSLHMHIPEGPVSNPISRKPSLKTQNCKPSPPSALCCSPFVTELVIS